MLEPSNNFKMPSAGMGNRGLASGSRFQKPPNEQQVPMHSSQAQGMPMQSGGFMPPGQMMKQGMMQKPGMGNQQMGNSGINPSQGFWQQMFPQILQMMQQQQGGNQNQMGMQNRMKMGNQNPMANTSGMMRKTMSGY